MADPQLVLVVDDSSTQRCHIKNILEADGFEVETAEGGADAIVKIDARPPLLVITDLQMPDISGLELVQTLRGSHPSIPVVLATSQGSEEIAAEALRVGAASYVPKHHVATTLTQVVRQVLSTTEATRSVREVGKFAVESSLKLCLVNDETLVPKVIARLELALAELDLFDEGTRMQIAMALDECLLNAMVHGNLEVGSELREVDDGAAYFDTIARRKIASPYKDRRVLLEMHATPAQVRYVIRDEGPGFDLESVADPTDPDQLESLGGRGLMLITAFMDEVQHNDRGNEIVMIKKS